jgi:hypothetical protein
MKKYTRDQVPAAPGTKYQLSYYDKDGFNDHGAFTAVIAGEEG